MRKRRVHEGAFGYVAEHRGPPPRDAILETAKVEVLKAARRCAAMLGPDTARAIFAAAADAVAPIQTVKRDYAEPIEYDAGFVRPDRCLVNGVHP